MATTDRPTDESSATLARVVAGTLAYETLPDFETYNVACWAVEDSVSMVSDGIEVGA